MYISPVLVLMLFGAFIGNALLVNVLKCSTFVYPSS